MFRGGKGLTRAPGEELNTNSRVNTLLEDIGKVAHKRTIKNLKHTINDKEEEKESTKNKEERLLF